jgi:hypothetical protein
MLAVVALGARLGLRGVEPVEPPIPSPTTIALDAAPDAAPETVVPTGAPVGAEPPAPPPPSIPTEEAVSPARPMDATTPVPFSEGPFVYGTSYNGNALLAYRLGTGPSARALVGGIHGGYEWNTTSLVSKTLTRLQRTPDLIPSDVTLYVIPCANPDGVAAGTDALHGRVNGNGVDLNRNWGYRHQVTATHGTRPVFAGEAPFSEPETRALRDLTFERDVELVVFYHSAMGKIFSGANAETSATLELAEMMSQATGYLQTSHGVPGQIGTGQAIDYLSKAGIAAVDVELATHEAIDWERNWQGVLAFLNWDVPYGDRSIRHRVRAGETLSLVALTYGVGEREILLLNRGIEHPDEIRAGQVIRIPISGKPRIDDGPITSP